MDGSQFQELRAAQSSLPPRRPVEKSPRSSEKCARCRRMRLKCEPVERVWPGQKCHRCEKHRQPCGPNLSRKEEARTQAQMRQLDAASTLNSSSIPSNNNQGGCAPGADRMDTGDSGSSSEGMSGTDKTGAKYFDPFSRRNLGDNVDKLLLKLGYLLMFLGYITNTGGIPSREAMISAAFLDAVKDALRETITELEFTIPKLARLAEVAAGKGGNVQADRIFRHLLDAMKASELSGRVRRSTLSKMVSFYQGIGDEPQVQKALQILSPLSTSHNSDPRIDPHKMLAKSFLTNSRLMSRTVARVLPSKGSSVRSVHSPALHQSIRCENPEVFRSVLNAITKTQDDPEASNTGDELINDPLDPNKDLEGRDTRNRTALFIACYVGDEDKCERLIYSGARVNEMDCYGHSILEIAARKGLFSTVQSLIWSQAEVNPDIVRNASTPLQAAAEHGHLDIVRLLLFSGAKVHVERLDKKTAQQLAQENGHDAIVKVLSEWHNGKGSQASADGETARQLHHAIQMVPGEQHQFLGAVQSAGALPMAQQVDGMMQVDSSQGFGVNCMTPGDAFSADGQQFDDFIFANMTGGCQELPNYDSPLPPLDPSFHLSGMVSDMDMRR